MMIKKQAGHLLASLLFIGCSLQASAHPAPGYNSIDAFWAGFKVAVINGDKGGVARMTQFPLAMPYGVPAIRTRSQSPDNINE